MKLNEQFFKGKKIAIVANRPPVTLVQRDGSSVIERGIGGLIAALEPLVERFNGTWFCTTSKSSSLNKLSDAELPYKVACLELTEKEYKRHSEGYSNKQLWPIFHYFPTRCIFDDTDWITYKSINEKMAKLILENVDEDTFIWIHDYHFLLLPEMLRYANPNLKIGFFLHIPFPNQEVFRLLANRTELLSGMLGADLVGFHTKGYVEHFLNCVRALLPEVKFNLRDNSFNVGERKITISNFPISIDFECVLHKASQEEMIKEVGKLKSAYQSDLIGISVDRLDYTKGTLERLSAIENFFDLFPEYIKKVTFIQISVPSRTEIETYQELKKQVDETVGRINGKLSKDAWRPIFYRYAKLPFHELIAHYALSDFALVVPLRDGMNLVSKEYIASKVNNKGVLILSEFTGGAEELTSALLINPYQRGLIAKTIKQAIELPVEEKVERMHKLREIVKVNDVYNWVNNYFKSFDEATKANKQVTKLH